MQHDYKRAVVKEEFRISSDITTFSFIYFTDPVRRSALSQSAFWSRDTHSIANAF